MQVFTRFLLKMCILSQLDLYKLTQALRRVNQPLREPCGDWSEPRPVKSVAATAKVSFSARHSSRRIGRNDFPSQTGLNLVCPPHSSHSDRSRVSYLLLPETPPVSSGKLYWKLPTDLQGSDTHKENPACSR